MTTRSNAACSAVRIPTTCGAGCGARSMVRVLVLVGAPWSACAGSDVPATAAAIATAAKVRIIVASSELRDSTTPNRAFGLSAGSRDRDVGADLHAVAVGAAQQQ